ncbi:MAG: hypothetical protein AB9917_04965 [Negativicutes bacterium]
MKIADVHGSATIATIISLTVLICLSGALAHLMRTETDSAINFRDGIAAQCLAEAGLRRAIVVLYKNGNPHGLAETITRNNSTGNYQVATSTEGTALRVRATGKVGGARRSISALVAVVLTTANDQSFTELTILSWDN